MCVCVQVADAAEVLRAVLAGDYGDEADFARMAGAPPPEAPGAGGTAPSKVRRSETMGR